METEAEFRARKFEELQERYDRAYEAGEPFYSENERGELSRPVGGCRRRSQMSYSERGLNLHKPEHDAVAQDID